MIQGKETYTVDTGSVLKIQIYPESLACRANTSNCGKSSFACTRMRRSAAGWPPGFVRGKIWNAYILLKRLLDASFLPEPELFSLSDATWSHSEGTLTRPDAVWTPSYG